MNSLPKEITRIIRSLISSESVSLHEPHFFGNETKYIQECINSTFVSSIGNFVDRFEDELTKFTKAKYAIAVVNGTEALHVALLLAGIKPQDEILIPALTFIATANAVHYCQAIPHFVDSEESTLGINPDSLRLYLKSITEQRSGYCFNRKTGRRISAVIPVHVFGHPCRIDEIVALAKDFNLIMIEDAAESLGSKYQGQHTGTFGLFGTLSFNGNKTITTGGGGAILTNNLELANYAKHLTTTAKLSHRWEYIHDEIGFNYRMPNINAALGCAQMENLAKILISKRKLYRSYKRAFKDLKGVQVFGEPQSCQSNFWLQTLLLDKKVAKYRNKVLESTNKEGIATRPAWKLLNKLKPYKKNPCMPLDDAECLENRIVNLPSSTWVK